MKTYTLTEKDMRELEGILDLLGNIGIVGATVHVINAAEDLAGEIEDNELDYDTEEITLYTEEARKEMGHVDIARQHLKWFIEDMERLKINEE